VLSEKTIRIVKEITPLVAANAEIVGSNLLAAIKDVMGNGATDEIVEAVAEAYGFLADLFIGREWAIYEEQASLPGGWNGTRTFFVAKPVVLIAGGIGVTPLLSMAKSLVKENSEAKIYFLQAAHNSKVQAFANELRSLGDAGPNVCTKVIFDAPMPGDVESGKCDISGFVTTELIRSWTPYSEADFYFCGPKPFMRNVSDSLHELGVSEDRVRYEFFGPKEDLVAASV
jgi:hypothetical protein